MAETRDLARRATDGAPASEREGRVADDVLVDGIARHDHAALAEVYRQHGNRVHALARGVCGADRADDLTTQIFLELWNDPQRFDIERGSLRSHLLMQTHERAVGLLRSDSAHAAREPGQLRPEGDEWAGSEALALTLLERAEIDDLVAALPAEERHPIVLAYFGGHTYREVAQLLAVPEDTISSRIRSGLEHLLTEGAAQDLRRSQG